MQTEIKNDTTKPKAMEMQEAVTYTCPCTQKFTLQNKAIAQSVG